MYDKLQGMTNKYALVALDAVKLYQNDLAGTPVEAWNLATEKYFEPGSSSQKKGCPRNTFLSLCEEGLIEGIPSGDYTRSVKTSDMH